MDYQDRLREALGGKKIIPSVTEPICEPEPLDLDYDNIGFKIGDTVTIIDSGKRYPGYDSWHGLKGYKRRFGITGCLNISAKYEILNLEPHGKGFGRMLALIQEIGGTDEVFIIGIEGITKWR